MFQDNDTIFNGLQGSFISFSATESDDDSFLIKRLDELKDENTNLSKKIIELQQLNDHLISQHNDIDKKFKQFKRYGYYIIIGSLLSSCLRFTFKRYE